MTAKNATSLSQARAALHQENYAIALRRFLKCGNLEGARLAIDAILEIKAATPWTLDAIKAFKRLEVKNYLSRLD